MKKLLVLLLLFSNLIPVSPAEAACTATKSSGNVKVGASTSNTSVTVCLTASSSASNTKTSAPVKKVVAPAPAPKPTPVPCVIQVPNATAAYGLNVSGCTVKIVPPVAAVITVSKPKPVTTVVASSQSDQAAFTPNPVGISASATTGVVGQAFFFSAIASAHTSAATILGKAAEVSFTPVSYNWGAGSGSSYSTSWSSEGTYAVSLTVGYAASYTVGSGWIDAGIIYSSAGVEVTVNSIALPAVTKLLPPRLVSGNCISKPSSYRC